MQILIKNGRVIDPANNIDEQLSILIEDSKINTVSKNIKPSSGAKIIDAAGKVVVPGLIDMHVHLREPGYEYKETIHTGTKAGAFGGFTSIACMPNTNPVIDNQGIVEFVISKAKKEGLINVFPIGCITKGQKGEELAEIGELVSSGVVAVSDDGEPVMNPAIMKAVLEYTKMYNIPVISHAEDKKLSQNGCMNEGFTSTRLGIKGIPKIAEEIMISRDIFIAEYTSGRLHFAHVSTKNSVELIRQAKKKGIKVTAEAAPHNFTLTDECLKGYNTNFKMNPPLRDKNDVEAIKEGLSDGTIDAIASDHAPHNIASKDIEFDLASFGIIGLETSLSISLQLVHEKVLSLPELIKRMSCNPSKILNLDKGTLSPSRDADITIIDIDKEFTVDINTFQSKSRNSPFHEWKFKGKTWMTIVGGKIVYEEDNIS
ncbi:MAG: dihydroorotase [Candidatus Firestonebacteria bacterium]|nr:dihydroorotase [Candidatus Firestonebacteria bacterium]